VRALVLVDSGLPGAATSEAIRAYGAAEEEAVERGDLDGAVELNLRMWVDGPHREPGDVDPAVRAAVGEMTRRSIELVLPFWDSFDEELLVPDVADRLADVRARTLVVLGELDVVDFHTIARRLAESIPGARLETIPGTAHLPSLERPDLFDPLVLDFLADALS
jgi:pimeloyl-ACP methyl ester carboxylesterase